MLFKSLILFSALTATLVSAQSWLDSLAACEQRCAIAYAEKVGCKPDDYKCLCTSDDFTKLFIDCTSSSCPSLPYPGAPAPGYEVLEKYCKSIDWTWDVPPCGKECIVKAAETIGCKWNDIACICRRREEFIKILTECLASHCGDKETIISIIKTLDRLCGQTTSPTIIPTTKPTTTFASTTPTVIPTTKPTTTILPTTTKPTTTFITSTPTSSTTCATITAWSTLTTTSVIVRTATVVVTSTSTFTATCPTTTVTTTVRPTFVTSIPTVIPTVITTVKPTKTLTFNPTLIPVDPTKIILP